MFTDEPKINGLMIRNRLRNLIMLEGREAHDQVVARLPDAMREALGGGGIVPGGWYPIGWLRDMHAIMDRVLGVGPDFARKLGYYGAKQNLCGIHKAYVAHITPDAMLTETARLFHIYYERGEMAVLVPEPGVAVGRWTECIGFDGNLWNATLGSAEAVLEVCGIRDLFVELTAGGGEMDHAEITARWPQTG